MKKKKGWLLCVLFLLSTLAGFVCKKDKHKKQTVYKFSFYLEDKDANAQILSADAASLKIKDLLKESGCTSAEYESYATQGAVMTDDRDTLVFAVILPPEKKARDISTMIQKELNLSRSWYIKEEHSYYELKKALQ